MLLRLALRSGAGHHRTSPLFATTHSTPPSLSFFPSKSVLMDNKQAGSRFLSAQRNPEPRPAAPTSKPAPECDPETDQDEIAGQTQQQSQEPGDIMSHSFGEGYSTRSIEEGFGGIYGESQSLVYKKVTVSQVVDEAHPDYDRTQGSVVKEKEKGRNSLPPEEDHAE